MDALQWWPGPQHKSHPCVRHSNPIHVVLLIILGIALSRWRSVIVDFRVLQLSVSLLPSVDVSSIVFVFVIRRLDDLSTTIDIEIMGPRRHLTRITDWSIWSTVCLSLSLSLRRLNRILIGSLRPCSRQLNSYHRGSIGEFALLFMSMLSSYFFSSSAV